jgi:hypothetical protein
MTAVVGHEDLGALAGRQRAHLTQHVLDGRGHRAHERLVAAGVAGLLGLPRVVRVPEVIGADRDQDDVGARRRARMLSS